MTGKCFLCMTICDQTCSNGHYYCSEDHLRGHQSADQECYPFEVKESQVWRVMSVVEILTCSK